MFTRYLPHRAFNMSVAVCRNCLFRIILQDPCTVDIYCSVDNYSKYYFFFPFILGLEELLVQL